MNNALCAGHHDPDMFFPGRGQSARANEAKRICMMCPVKLECKAYRKRTGSTDGIWGGESTKRGAR